MKKILITGGAGNVAGSLAATLVENENDFVVIIDNLLTGSKEKLPPITKKNWVFIEGDVNDFAFLQNVFAQHQFDFVFHYAAVVGVKRTLDNPLMVLDDITGMKNILELCRITNVKRIFFSSSSEVYGEPVEIPQNELSTPLNARLPYAIVKSVNESYIKSYHQVYGLPYTIFRFFNTYGPRQSDDFVIVRFLKAALQHQDITVYGDGQQTRTFCYVKDNMDTTLRCLNDNMGINETINVGNDVEMTILQLAQAIIKHTNSSSKIVHLPPLPEGDMKRRCPDIGVMKAILQRQLTTLTEGLDITLAYIKQIS